jgi:hypothetical protein
MSIRRLHGALAFAVLTAILVAGCGSKGPVTIPIRGEVHYDGQLLRDVPQGLVSYMPKSPDSGRQASGRIQPDGTFVLTTFKRADGVVPGEYDVVVSAYSSKPASREEVEASKGGGMPPRLIIPKKYTDPSTSGISDIVNSEHSGFIRIDLSSQRGA